MYVLAGLCTDSATMTAEESQLLGGTHAEQLATGDILTVPNPRALQELLQQSGYNLVQENGQRKYGGPPPGWKGVAPQRGCEVFVGKIPRDLFEDELVPVLEMAGRLYELRLMMDFDGKNRGYAFAMYTSKQVYTEKQLPQRKITHNIRTANYIVLMLQ